jgi:signal transduction histidine kinase
MEDGLPNNTVQALAQTRDGYLWVGTREGLARFDGEKFEKIDLVAGHASPSISCLHEGRDGSLWIGTDSSGLFRLSTNTIERCKGVNEAIDFDVREIHEAGDGAIWISSSGEALRLVGGKFERQAKLRRVQQGLCVDTNGAVWTVAMGMTRLDSEAATNYVPQSGSLAFTARCLYCDPNGIFWMGDGDNLIQLKNGTVTNFHKPDGPSGYVSVIFQNNAGELWVGSYLGLRRFVNGKFISQSEPDAPQYRIYDIFEDRERNLWVGSEEGLLRLTPKIFKTITKKEGLTVNTVASVCASRDGSVWMSPWGFGLNHWVDGKISALSVKNGLSSDYIMAMTEGQDGSLWAGADNGGALNRIKDGQITTYGQEQGFTMSRSTATTALFEDDRRVLWIGSRELLQCWEENHFSRFTTNNGLSHQKINAICGGTGGVVWIGTEAGLTRWQDGRFENLAATNSSLQALILSLYEDAEGSLWIGTKGNGLLRLKDGIVKEFTSAQGLFSDAIYSILEDDHTNLWLNSSRGIFRLDKKQLEAVANGHQATITSISYGKADGILSSGQYKEVTQPSACKSADGRLWFRTTQGVAVVDPKEITLNKLPPEVVIQQIIADKQLVGNTVSKFEVDKQIVIPPGRGELEIHYEALSFRAPEKNQFRYKLEGVDYNWVDAGVRRVAFYNNLRPGHYRFHVMACNNDGVWSDASASVDLTVEPHFWQTWWFLSLAVLATASLIGGTARYITRRRMQRKLERLEQQNAIEKERARIARDMHDELGAKLTRISFQGDTARRCSSNSPETVQHITKMSETARELILSLDQIVWAVDPENDSLENLTNYVCRYASEFAADSPVQCKFKIPWKLPHCHLSTDVRHNVFLSVKEALNNAVKHSAATEIVLTISARPDEFEICIADNGQGIETSSKPQNNKRKGRGLSNMRERLESIHGKFELKSEPGRGTEIRLVIPLGKESDHAPYVYTN